MDNVETTGPAQWVATKGGEIPPNAIPAGFDNEQLYVGRANHEGAILPGKVVPSHGVCYVPWGGAEHGIPEYEVNNDFYKNMIIFLNKIIFNQMLLF